MTIQNQQNLQLVDKGTTVITWVANARNYLQWSRIVADGGIPSKGFGNVMDTFPEIGQLGAMPEIAEASDGFSLIGTAFLTCWATGVKVSPIWCVPHEMNCFKSEVDHLIQQKGLTGKGVLVGHLDTGVDATHSALSGRVAKFKRFGYRGMTDETMPAWDSGWHGTHTASLITAVAPDVQLYSGMVIEEGTLSHV